VQLGRDPRAERSERRERDRVQLRSVVDEYLDLAGKKLRAKTLYDNRRYLCGSYFKPLHERRWESKP
jgi:hypothetical protein